MTNPYAGNEPYVTAWQHGLDYGTQNPGSDQLTSPDFSGWGYDATTTGHIGQVWQEGVSAGRDGGSAGGAAGDGGTQQHGDADTGAGGGGQVQYDQAPAPGPVAAVGGDGQVVERGDATQVSRQGQIEPAPHALSIAVEVGLAGLSQIPGLGAAIAIFELAHSLGCTVAVGLSGEAAGVVGAAVGAGVYYTPSDQIGIYGSMAADLGAVIGADVSGAFTAVHGEADALAGNCLSVVFGGGEVVVGSGSALFSLDGGGFIGVAGTIGWGCGPAPVAAYAQFSHTWVRPLT